MLVDSQTSFADLQSAHACSDHDQLCCLSDSGGRTHFFKEVYQLGHPHWEVVNSDASLNGWGGLWQHRGIWGSWDPQLGASHINLLELWAVLFTLRHFRQELSGRHILVRTDNTTVVFIINYQGGTRSLDCLQLTRVLLLLANKHFLSVRAAHIPCCCNSVANSLSRSGPKPGEWCLHKEVVRSIWRIYRTAAVDLFASKATTHCPLWFLVQGDQGSLCQDALAYEWPDLLLYAFFLILFLWSVLRRVQEKHHRLILVAYQCSVGFSAVLIGRWTFSSHS